MERHTVPALQGLVQGQTSNQKTPGLAPVAAALRRARARTRSPGANTLLGNGITPGGIGHRPGIVDPGQPNHRVTDIDQASSMPGDARHLSPHRAEFLRRSR